jgi:hypothetical protein
MSEELSHEFETSQEPLIDRQLVVGRLQEYGIEIELEDLEDLDENDLLGEIANLVTMYDLDIDDILREVTPIESRTGNDAPPIATVGDSDNEI